MNAADRHGADGARSRSDGAAHSSCSPSLMPGTDPTIATMMMARPNILESIDEDEEIDMWNEVASRMYFSGGLVTPHKHATLTPRQDQIHGEWVDGYATLFGSTVEDMEVHRKTGSDKMQSAIQHSGGGDQAQARMAGVGLQNCVNATECTGAGGSSFGPTNVLFAASPSQSYLCACRSPAASGSSTRMGAPAPDAIGFGDAGVRMEPLREPSTIEIPWNDLVFWLGDSSTGEVKCVCASCLNSLCGGGNRLPLLLNLSAKIPVISAMPRIEGVN